MSALSKRHTLFYMYRAVVWLNASALGLLAAAAAAELAVGIADPGSFNDQLTLAIGWAFLGSVNITLLFFLRTWRPI
jgi:hypothetical protein